MSAVNQVMVEVLHMVRRSNHHLLRDVSTSTSSLSSSSTTTSAPSATSTDTSSGGGPTSSPLLFFVALGFGVVFTNLWIIVGVKYCFRYNARNRQLRAGEDGDPINLENMPTRPHRRRREKKLMTMDEVNERFPLTKYKNWVASRAREGLPTSGGVAASPSRAASLRNVEVTSSLVGTTDFVGSPTTRESGRETSDITISPPTNSLGGSFGDERSTIDGTVVGDQSAPPTVEESGLETLEEVHTTASTVDKHPTVITEEEEDDDDDHIHTAVPPELLTNPGDSCAICIDTLEDDDDIRGLTCGHAFHAGCLDPWLTSRRACCPLCKADYYTPKPRPEADGTDADRQRRANGAARMNLPQPPNSAWTGFRGSPRIVLPGGYSRGARRARREGASPAATTTLETATDTGAAENSAATTSRRWRPRVPVNPFSALSFPSRIRPFQTMVGDHDGQPSPAQLEAGVR